MRKIFLLIACALLLLQGAPAKAAPPEAAPSAAPPSAASQPATLEGRLKLLAGDWLSPRGTLILEIRGQKING